MALPGILPGGPSESYISSTGASIAGSGNTPCGVFAQFPGATPKYAFNKGTRDAEFRDTMARMYIDVPVIERDAFVRSFQNPETKKLARVLCGTSGIGFIDFLLTDVNESFQEKAQVVETMSDNFIVYAFGQRAPTFSYSGILLNTYQDDQRVWMMRMYQDIIRASQLAKRRKLLRLRYDSVIVTGIPIMHAQGLSAQSQMQASFQLQLIPTQYMVYTDPVGAPTVLTDPTKDKTVSKSDAKQTTATTPEPLKPTSVPAAPTYTLTYTPGYDAAIAIISHPISPADATSNRAQASVSTAPDPSYPVRGGKFMPMAE